jgi:hypothetical protein
VSMNLLEKRSYFGSFLTRMIVFERPSEKLGVLCESVNVANDSEMSDF